MKNILLYPSIIFIFEIIITSKNYFNFKKNSVKELKSFEHNSDMKIVSLTALILSLIFSCWIFTEYKINDYISLLLLLVYMIIVTINYWRKIIIFDSGVFINGRFIDWNSIDRVRKTPKDSIIIETTGKWKLSKTANRIKNVSELIEIVNSNLK